MLNVQLPRQNLSGLNIASKLGSVMINNGLCPSAGATEIIPSGCLWATALYAYHLAQWLHHLGDFQLC